MRLWWRLSIIDYLSWLMFLLGFCFQFSMGATNVLFYLFFLVCFLFVLKLSFQKKTIPWKSVYQSSLWRIVTAWIFFLYMSMLYSDATDSMLMLNYARKYAKYILVLIFAIAILLKFCDYQDLPKYFFLGLVAGGFVSFGLSVLNMSTGYLGDLARAKIIPWKYVYGNGWISNDRFAYTLLMSTVSLYAFIMWKVTMRWYFLLLTSLATFCVFIVSDQKTGFFCFFVLVLWLLIQFSPKLKLKLSMCLFCVVIAFSFLLFFSKNKISQDFARESYDSQKCYKKYNYAKSVLVLRFCYSSIGLRILFYGDSIEQIKKSPFYGHGLANLDVRSIERKKISKKGEKKQYSYSFTKSDNPHNEYLLQGIQLGIPGIVILMTIFTLAYRHAMEIQNNRRYVYGGIVVMYVVSCLFNSYLLDATQGLFFTIILSFIIAERAHEKSLNTG